LCAVGANRLQALLVAGFQTNLLAQQARQHIAQAVHHLVQRQQRRLETAPSGQGRELRHQRTAALRGGVDLLGLAPQRALSRQLVEQ
jgi:hypothetical protein